MTGRNFAGGKGVSSIHADVLRQNGGCYRGNRIAAALMIFIEFIDLLHIHAEPIDCFAVPSRVDL